jgi:pimeloyl-ACP methyl ester carboxylesterase
VLAFDLRGHGLSEKPAEPDRYTLAALVEDVEQVMTACRATRADVVGHSLGGALALHLALAHPERVRRLVLASPVGLTTIALPRIGCLLTPRITARFARLLVPRWLTSFLVRGAYGDPRRVSPDIIDEYWAPSQDPNYFRAVRALLHHFDWKPLDGAQLRGLSVPTQVILGGADRLIHGAEEGAREIRDASIVTLEDAGHLGIEEHPAAFNDALCRFLLG